MNARRALLASWLALLAATAGCGKKGPPLAPLRPVPAAVETFTARRLGDTVRLTLTVPSKNTDGTAPADLARLEVYGLTLAPDAPELGLDDFLKAATLVDTIEVKPPARPPAEGAPAPPPDPRPAQGAEVSVEEALAPAVREPFTPKTDTRAALGRPIAVRTLAALTPDDGPARTYVAVGYSHHGQRSPSSPRLVVSLRPAPAPPAGLSLTYGETTFTLTWTPAPADPWKPIWTVLGYARGVNVYEVKGEGTTVPAPLNPALATGDSVDVPLTAFGVERCFAVRAVATEHGQTVEGALSPPVCATPRDTFPPAAPTGLAAVAGPDGVSLIWDANHEPDLAGYLVLRGEATGGPLRALTPSPIRETTYRDTSVRPGVRYVYAVVAVDNANPPNMSAQSAHVEETVR